MHTAGKHIQGGPKSKPHVLNVTLKVSNRFPSDSACNHSDESLTTWNVPLHLTWHLPYLVMLRDTIQICDKVV